MRTPLQIVLFRDLANRQLDIYAETLRLAFEGSADSADSPNAYISEAIDLGIRVLEPIDELVEGDALRLNNGARHTILVIIGEQEIKGRILESIVGETKILRVPLPLQNLDDHVQGKRMPDGVEPAFAPIVTALRAMNLARSILFTNSENGSKDLDNLKLFISHAKLDGLAMAKSFIGLLQQLQGIDKGKSKFEFFYDHEHITPGTNWRDVIRSEVSLSVLIVLRTEAYENRYWCRKEYIWAEKCGMPIIVVDLRKEQYHDRALLPFDIAPTVRVHDGNLIRIIFHAFATHLRVLRVMSEASVGIKVLPNRPSVFSIGEVCRLGGSYQKIAYPGPRLAEAYIRAIDPILSQATPPVELITYDDIGGY